MVFSLQKERSVLAVCARRLDSAVPPGPGLGLALTTCQSPSVLPLACTRKLSRDLLQEAERISL